MSAAAASPLTISVSINSYMSIATVWIRISWTLRSRYCSSAHKVETVIWWWSNLLTNNTVSHNFAKSQVISSVYKLNLNVSTSQVAINSSCSCIQLTSSAWRIVESIWIVSNSYSVIGESFSTTVFSVEEFDFTDCIFHSQISSPPSLEVAISVSAAASRPLTIGISINSSSRMTTPPSWTLPSSYCSSKQVIRIIWLFIMVLSETNECTVCFDFA